MKFIKSIGNCKGCGDAEQDPEEGESLENGLCVGCRPVHFRRVGNNGRFYEAEHSQGANKDITLECKHCQSLHFHVASGSYLTVAQCVNCGWERVIHDG